MIPLSLKDEGGGAARPEMKTFLSFLHAKSYDSAAIMTPFWQTLYIFNPLPISH